MYIVFMFWLHEVDRETCCGHDPLHWPRKPFLHALHLSVDTCVCVYSPTFPEQHDVHYGTITTTEFRALH